eukprot:Gb_04930 [translate_table: standard]
MADMEDSSTRSLVPPLHPTSLTLFPGLGI